MQTKDESYAETRSIQHEQDMSTPNGKVLLMRKRRIIIEGVRMRDDQHKEGQHQSSPWLGHCW
eukprot:scaffold2933_cov83-Skeletonema_dohrnii-CCMP3373.AAC.1